MTDKPRVAVFRPDDERLADAIDLLESLGVLAVSDPMLAVEATGARPRTDADYVVFTSKTGVDLLPAKWDPHGATLCAIGARTAEALEAIGRSADLVPETYSSRGLVAVLADQVDGARVEIARSDHGSPVLLEGLGKAGAYCHETVLYRLVRPSAAGQSTEAAAAGELDAAVFTSSLTVEHFLAAAAERELEEAAVVGLQRAVVGTIGEPTRKTAEANGIAVDIVPETATFEALAQAVVEQLEA